MGFVQKYVCDVCGKEKPTSTDPYYGRGDGPAEWYKVRSPRSQSIKLVCTITCLRNFPTPAPAKKKAPAKKVTKKR